ncbi:thiamine phosphate synthase [Taibaiella koreensis]|uniref:thiamine phosphate synthase n=1 Tax=Taibaiella koreensis TaxID=1268548 RepID=UPI0013C2C7F5|nr:thiamine phosphate synthase [Taibaiella koreensis]
MPGLILISEPGHRENEAQLLNGMFAAGLSLLHLRKPEQAMGEVFSLLTAIDPAYRERIVLPFSLTQRNRSPFPEYRRIHFPGQLRQRTKPEYFSALRDKGYLLSTSIHEMASLDALPPAFAYTFLGPVFDSISKPGYAAMDREVLMQLPEARRTKVIALGGINEENCRTALDYGFDGVAVLGAVWHSEDPLGQFKKIQACLMKDR